MKVNKKQDQYVETFGTRGSGSTSVISQRKVELKCKTRQDLQSVITGNRMMMTFNINLLGRTKSSELAAATSSDQTDT